jgi:urate oxidase
MKISYGKAEVSFYRTHARPLRGVTTIPESAFTGRDNTLFGGTMTIVVLGEGFKQAYAEGNNSRVVATDTMKNFIHAKALAYEGATLEGFAMFVARELLSTYPEMERVLVSARETPVRGQSEKLFSLAGGDYGIVELEAGPADLEQLQAGRAGMRLVKLTGSAFKGFVRDRYTTLPDVPDRPLFIHLDVSWRYGQAEDASGEDPSRYVASEQVRDLVAATFDSFVSMSIQHLVHEMAGRALERFPQLSEVSLAAENRLWDTAAVSEANPGIRVYSEPRPAHGTITLTLTRDP